MKNDIKVKLRNLAKKYDAVAEIEAKEFTTAFTFSNERGNISFDIENDMLDKDEIYDIIAAFEPRVRDYCGPDERPLLAQLLRIEKPKVSLYLADMEWFENDLRLKAKDFEFVRSLAMDIANNLECFKKDGFPEPMLFNDHWTKAYPAACSIACLCMSLTTLPYRARLKLTGRPWEYLMIEFEYNDIKESYEFGWEVLFWGFNMEHITTAFNKAINEHLYSLHKLRNFPRVEERRYLLELIKVPEIKEIYNRGPGFTKYFEQVEDGVWVPKQKKEESDD